MKATQTISAVLLVLLPLLASCASPGKESSFTAASNKNGTRLVLLTNEGGNLRLSAPVEAIGLIQLQAHGDILIGSGVGFASNSGCPGIVVNGERFLTLATARATSGAVLQSNDWHYVRLDGATAPTGALKSAHRHLLLIEPDLVVILDELALTNSAAVELGFPFARPPVHDALRDEWNLQSPHAGLTARFLTSPKCAQDWSMLTPAAVGGASTNSAPGCVRSMVAESSYKFYQVTILAVHPDQSRRSLAFKLLESDTAIGARIHRDGLPTLVAFRKASCAGEANLTGLKFTAPVAVDVFRPRKKK